MVELVEAEATPSAALVVLNLVMVIQALVVADKEVVFPLGPSRSVEMSTTERINA